MWRQSVEANLSVRAYHELLVQTKSFMSVIRSRQPFIFNEHWRRRRLTSRRQWAARCQWPEHQFELNFMQMSCDDAKAAANCRPGFPQQEKKKKMKTRRKQVVEDGGKTDHGGVPEAVRHVFVYLQRGPKISNHICQRSYVQSASSWRRG